MRTKYYINQSLKDKSEDFKLYMSREVANVVHQTYM